MYSLDKNPAARGNRQAAVLWTGGKDCALALHQVAAAGVGIECMVTFMPPSARFRSHPLHIIESQVRAVGRPWHRREITEPYFESYRDALRSLRDDLGVNVVVTGDIAEVDGHPNWIRECAAGLNIEVMTPLWGMERTEILDALLDNGFKVMMSAVKLSALDISWLGREIDRQAIDELTNLHRLKRVDPCGESGEYHSIVLNAPFFEHEVNVTIAGSSEDGGLAFAELR